MWRYGLTILIAVLAISGIGAYYAIGRLNHLPEYKLETVQGEPEEGAAVSLSGSYLGDMRSEPLNVNIEGSIYRSEDKVFRKRMMDARSWFYNQPDIQKLLKDHKSFMRGKGYETGFYRDEELVIYADVTTKGLNSDAQKSVLRLSLLSEDSGKVTDFEQTILEMPDNGQLSIQDVQRVDDEAHLLFRKYIDRGITEELVVYVFDIGTGEQLRHSTLASWSDKNKYKSDAQTARVIASDYISAPQDMIFVILNGKEYTYSYRSGLLTELTDPLWHKALGTGMAHSLQQDNFYYSEVRQDRIVLSRYNFITKEQETSYVTLTAEQLGVGVIKSALIRSNRVYLLADDKAGIPGAAVLDLANGELLYAGRAVEVGDEGKTGAELSENLRLLNINIVEKLAD